MKLLQSKDYTETEIRSKLRGDGYPENVIKIAVEYLYSFHYLDDARYAEAYYRSRCVRKSKKQIIMELQQKGVNKELIIDTLESVCSDSPEEDELQCISKLLAKRKYNDNEADITEREKVKAYLFRKGFQIDNINSCMRNFDWKNT
ncbi:MAG: regulatory protein RecX [Lachnospiraceae bacterium]|nr:regulatory protein RecX [Lachnospiraceae bacterium]